MVDNGAEVIVMEVSSQSLKLYRVEGCEFDIGVFTNFSQDHISKNEHPDMIDYFVSKIELMKKSKICFTNSDDLYTAKVPRLLDFKNISTFGIDNYANFMAKDITLTDSYADFKAKLGQKNERVKVYMPGRFSIYNALAAICVCLHLGASSENIIAALAEVKVPGRCELVNNRKELNIMIDYAHSPESLENILTAVKSYTKGRVICLFGCGGDRDTSKRSIMGEISGKLADYTIITSDNPRTEEPNAIINQIERGIKKTKGQYVCIVDRVEAIKHAISIANKNDFIILAGKGHETYQIIGNEKHSFNEKKIINDIISNIK